jgi:hypothetical protein
MAAVGSGGRHHRAEAAFAGMAELTRGAEQCSFAETVAGAGELAGLLQGPLVAAEGMGAIERLLGGDHRRFAMELAGRCQGLALVIAGDALAAEILVELFGYALGFHEVAGGGRGVQATHQPVALAQGAIDLSGFGWPRHVSTHHRSPFEAPHDTGRKGRGAPYEFAETKAKENLSFPRNRAKCQIIAMNYRVNQDFRLGA